MRINFDELADNYMHDARAWVIEAGATGAVLLSTLIGSIIAKKAAKQAAIDCAGVVSGEAFQAADAAIAAKVGRHLSNRFIRFAYAGVQKAGTGARWLATRIGVSAIVGGILMIDTAAEAVSLAYRIKDLGIMTLKRLPYDDRHLDLFASLMTRQTREEGMISSDLSITQNEAALLILLTHPNYSDCHPSAQAVKAFRDLYETSLFKETAADEIMTIRVCGRKTDIDRFQKFLADLSRTYSSFRRDDLLVVNILAIIVSKIKLKPGFNTFGIAAKVFAIGE